MSKKSKTTKTAAAKKRAKQCRRAPAAPKTVECEPMKRNRKGQFVASGGRRQQKSRRKRRRSNPEPAANPPRRRKRRRSNPDLGNIGAGVMASLKRVANEALPRIGAKIATGLVVRRWGNPWGPGIMGPGELGSEYAGKGWTLWNYVLALGVAAIGAPIVNRWKPGWGRVWQDSIVDDIFGRLVYTEIIGRSKWAQGAFGADVMPIGWEDDGAGNRYALMEGTGYRPAMLGLQEAGRLGALQEAGRLGALQEAGRLGALRSRRRGGMGGDPYITADGSDVYAVTSGAAA